MITQARALLRHGANSVLIKGGHGAGAEASIFWSAPTPSLGVRLAAPRVATQSTHGSGCTLSSAIAAGLAKGLDLVEAVHAAKAYVTAAIAKADAVKVGQGHGPLHHFHAFW